MKTFSTSFVKKEIHKIVTFGVIALYSYTAVSIPNRLGFDMKLLTASITNVTQSVTSGNLTINDNRGTGAGWTVAATAKDFSVINQAIKIAGANNTVTLGGRYNSSESGIYTNIPDLLLNIPSNTQPNIYTSTITATII